MNLPWPGDPTWQVRVFAQRTAAFRPIKESVPNRHHAGYESALMWLRAHDVDAEVVAGDLHQMLATLYASREELLSSTNVAEREALTVFVGNLLCHLRPYAEWLKFGDKLEVGDRERRYPVDALMSAVLDAKDDKSLKEIAENLEEWRTEPARLPRWRRTA